MVCRIPFPEQILALGILSMPLGLGVNLSLFITSAARCKTLFNDYLGMIISYAASLAAAALLGAFILQDVNLYAEYYWYMLAPFIGAAAVAAEYAAGVLIQFASTGSRTYGFAVHPVYSGRKSVIAPDIAAIAVFAILEELIFRFAITGLLLKSGINMTLVIALSAVIFAFNHIHFGIQTAIVKVISGLIFEGVYVISGNCIVIPIAAHLVQNFILLLLSRKMHAEEMDNASGGNG